MRNRQLTLSEVRNLVGPVTCDKCYTPMAATLESPRFFICERQIHFKIIKWDEIERLERQRARQAQQKKGREAR